MSKRRAPSGYDPDLGVDTPGFYTKADADLEFLPDEEKEILRQRERDIRPFDLPRRRRSRRGSRSSYVLMDSTQLLPTDTKEIA